MTVPGATSPAASPTGVPAGAGSAAATTAAAAATSTNSTYSSVNQLIHENPQAWKVILQGMAQAMITDVQHQNEHLIQEMKRERREQGG